MSRSRVLAPASGAAFLALVLLLLPGLARALVFDAPPLLPETRAALSNGAAGHGLLPWQRAAMRRLAAALAGLAGAPRTSGADGTWGEVPPPALEEAPAVYDPVRESMLFFGGRVSNSSRQSNDVWELKLSGTPAWSLMATTGSKPPARSGHVLLFDSRRERLLVFGGVDTMTHNDCWGLDLTTDPPEWGQGFPTGTPPSRRAYCQAVYDSLNDRAIVFGGADSLTEGETGGPFMFHNDVWSVPLAGTLEWIELTPSGTPPSARAAGAVIYDRARQRMVLFGGYDGAALSDAFTLSLGGSPAWAPLVTTGGPPPARAVPGVIHEAPQDRMVVFAGFTGVGAPYNDVWTLDLATAEWTEITPTGGPPSGRYSPATVYDAPRDRMVTCGGGDNLSGSVPDPLWALSLGASPAWTDLGGRRPPRRWDAASVVDPTRGVMWIHAGDSWNNNARAPRTDLWKLSLTGAPSWTEPATTGTPPGRRIGHSAIYDPVRDRLLFFGGNDTLTYLNDVWSLSLAGTPAWSQLAPAGTPPGGRSFHSAAYDAVNDRMVVFGGSAGFAGMNDVWALSLAGSPTWTQLFPSGTPPPPLWGQSAALDRDANRLIVFGGQDGGTLSNAVYALSLTGSPAWTHLFPTGVPPTGRRMPAMVSLGTRMLVHGGGIGMSGSAASNETWLLSLYPTPSWRLLDVGPTLPEGAWSMCAGFDQATFRLATFGGVGDNFSGAETWMLQLDQVVPTLASLASANASVGRVDLAWEVTAPLGPIAIQRSAGGGEWTTLARLSPDGNGRIAWTDLDVAAGTRYGYRLALPGEAGESFAGEVWLEVPAAARFALRGMRPNPGPAGAALVSFSLPDAASARLEVMDVAGRRVFSREVGALGGGEHVVRVSGDRPMEPGVYVVRLTRGGESLIVKAVTVR